MKAVIMAAGMGTRFGKMTETIPKGFIPVDGKPMIVRSIETLLSNGIEEIIIGTGYHAEKYDELKSMFPQVRTCFSPRYAETNSMYTLYNTRSLIDDNFVLLESDLIFDHEAISVLIKSAYDDAMLATPVQKFQDQYYIEYNSENVLVNCSTERRDLHFQGEMVGIHKLSLPFYKIMCDDYSKQLDQKPKLGYEYELLRMSRFFIPLHVVMAPEVHWYEIDDEKDLEYAEKNVSKFCI